MYLDPANNNRKNASYRVSQAVSANYSSPYYPICVSPGKLSVYRSIVLLSIFLHAMDRVLLLPSPQVRKLDALHYKSLRRILRSSLPSITGSLMAYQKRKAISSSQLYSRQRMENRCTYMSSHAYLGIRAPNHSGRPKFHWAESCMAQAVHRIDHLWSDAAPAHDQLGLFLSSPRANKYEMLIALQV